MKRPYLYQGFIAIVSHVIKISMNQNKALINIHEKARCTSKFIVGVANGNKMASH